MKQVVRYSVMVHAAEGSVVPKEGTEDDEDEDVRIAEETLSEGASPSPMPLVVGGGGFRHFLIAVLTSHFPSIAAKVWPFSRPTIDATLETPSLLLFTVCIDPPTWRERVDHRERDRDRETHTQFAKKGSVAGCARELKQKSRRYPDNGGTRLSLYFDDKAGTLQLKN